MISGATDRRQEIDVVRETIPTAIVPRKRPVRESNPSRLFDKQVVTPASSQGDVGSKGGRSRTLCLRVGAAVLSQEHALVEGLRSAEGEGVEPSRLVARPGSSRVPSPVGLPFRRCRLWRQVGNLPLHSVDDGSRFEVRDYFRSANFLLKAFSAVSWTWRR